MQNIAHFQSCLKKLTVEEINVLRYNIVVLITVLFKGVQHLTQIVMYGIQWCVPASFVNPVTCTLNHNMKPVIFFSIFPHQFVLFSWFLSYCCDNYIIKHITMNQILHLILWCNAETETAFMSKNDLQRVRTWQFFWLNYWVFFLENITLIDLKTAKLHVIDVYAFFWRI